MNIKQLIESSKVIEPYKPRPVGDVLKLNANENLFLSKETLRDILVEAAMETDSRLYPQDEEETLKLLIAELNNVEPKQVLISAGGDHVIELLFSLLGVEESITAVSPTFSMYPRVALQRGLEYREAMLEPDFSLNIEDTLDVAKGSSILVVCNPNNPTSNQFPTRDILELVNCFEGLVLVDEAYQEYSDYSLIDAVDEYDNLVILRTFSKAFGLAGLRLGYLVANSELASMLRERYLSPFPVSNIALKTGSKIIQQYGFIEKAIEKTKREREWLVNQLNNLEGVEAFPSNANFVLFNTEKSYEAVFEELQSRGVLIRKIGAILGRKNCLRVSVAPRPILIQFLDALKETIK
jgi:histidinol-phosphate aminotransferase